MAHLEMANVCKQYGNRTVLDHVSLDVEKGEFVCVLGPSGCGKSTLLRVLAGLEDIRSGSVCIGGVDVTIDPPAKRNFGIVFQSYALFPNLTVEQNIAYGLANRKLSKTERQDKVGRVVEQVNLQEHRRKYPQELSGGQQQRVALARAIVLEPQFLLLDEPLSALDAKVRMRLRREIKALQQHLRITTIMVTHDQEEALSMADQIVVMNNAVIEQVGTPQEVYESPKSKFVADFIGTVNIIGNTYAIRPENIVLVEQGITPDTLHGTILNIEYRGAFYRVSIDSMLGEMSIDIRAESLHKARMQAGMDIYVS